MEHAYLSKIGGRKTNEDCVGVFEIENQSIYILADGLGGHNGGEIASKQVTEAIFDFLNTDQQLESQLIIEHSFKIAHQRLKKIQEENKGRYICMTTLVMLVVSEETLIWGHIGDSRLYYFYDCKLVERTLDHSLIQNRVDTGELLEINIRNHKDRNKLLKAVGSEDDMLIPTISEKKMKHENSGILLCSDGFWENIEDKQMLDELSKGVKAKEWLDGMEKIVIKNGQNKKMDNYSAITILI